MTGDARFGLLLGVGMVVAAAFVYYRPETPRSPKNDSAKVQVPLSPKPVRLSKMSTTTPPTESNSR